MADTDVFSLPGSGMNQFIFAPDEADSGAISLTVLSVLARPRVDPRQAADRPAGLPRLVPEGGSAASGVEPAGVPLRYHPPPGAGQCCGPLAGTAA